MASAESQGKTIALVIMIVMFVASAATAYYFYDKVDGAEKQRIAAVGEKTKADGEARKAQTEYGELRALVSGQNAGTADHAKVMEICQAKLQNPNTQSPRKKAGAAPRAAFDSYFNMIDAYNASIGALNKELAAFDEDKAKLESTITSVSGTYRAKNEETEGELTKRRNELKDQTDQSQKVLEDNNIRMTDAQQRFAKKNQEYEQLKRDSDFKIEALEKAIAKLDLIMGRIVQQQQRGQERRFNTEDGEVVQVQGGGKEAYINIGRLDGVGEGLSFGIYGTDRTGFTQSLPKASLEVTQILGDHQALARIADFNNADPVLPGDKIFNPVWDRGRKTGIAVLGLIDMDDDGRADNEEFKRLIERWGGRIDAEVDLKTFKPVGRITINTDWLVEGTIPEAAEAGAIEAEDAANIRSAVTQAADKFRKEARLHAVRPVNVHNFLAFMGYRTALKVQQAGEEERYRNKLREQQTKRLKANPGDDIDADVDRDRLQKDIAKSLKKGDNAADADEGKKAPKAKAGADDEGTPPPKKPAGKKKNSSEDGDL